jgi:hypothetical protein
MYSKARPGILRTYNNSTSKKSKNTSTLNLTTKPLKQTSSRLIISMLSDIKSLIKTTVEKNQNTLKIPPFKYDEFFNILNQIVSLNKQCSNLNKNQNVDNIINSSKTSLTKDIYSFFKDLEVITPFHKDNIIFSIENVSKLNICAKHISNFKLDFDEVELLNNKNIIEKIKAKINSKQSNKTIQVYKPQTKINNLKLIKKHSNYKIKKLYKKYNIFNSSNINLTKPNSKPKTSRYPITGKSTPIKLKKKIVSRMNKKSDTIGKKISTDKCDLFSGTFSTKRKNHRKKTESFSSDIDCSLNDSCLSYLSNNLTKRFYSKYRIITVAPKPTLYTTYLMNKSKDIINHYQKEKQRQQKIDSSSFTDSYSHLFNIKRPQSTINRSKRYFSTIF